MDASLGIVLKADCPRCGPSRNAFVAGEHISSFDDHASGVWWETRYRILVCRGCDEPYFQREEVCSENIDHKQNETTGEWEPYLSPTTFFWPSASKREAPTWFHELSSVDVNLSDLMNDIYLCLNNDVRVPAAIAARTCFDRATELLGIDPAVSFDEKLKYLLRDGRISEREKETLQLLTDAGSAAAHRGWRPKVAELETMMTILEGFLHKSFILTKAAEKLKTSIPPKQKRRTTSADPSS